MRVTWTLLPLLAACAGGSPGADSGAPRPVITCDSLLQPDGSPTGLEYCWPDGQTGEGRLDRVSVVPCQVEPIDPAGACFGWGGGDNECEVNGDCGPDAVCGEPWGTCICTAVCREEADCASGESCLCSREPGGGAGPRFDQCLPAACTTGADCASGTCGVSVDSCGSDPEELACRTAADGCAFDADCPEGRCRYDGDRGRWDCLPIATCD